MKTGHNPHGWKRRLACFPGQFETASYNESWFERAEWEWLFGAREHRNYFTVTLQSPPEKLHRNLWRDFGRRGLMTGQGFCCQINTVTDGLFALRDLPRESANCSQFRADSMILRQTSVS